MNKYIDLVLCMDNQGKYILCKAPTGEYLEVGNKVLIDQEKVAVEAEVVESLTYANIDDERMQFILALARTTLEEVPKILCKISYNYFEYGEVE